MLWRRISHKLLTYFRCTTLMKICDTLPFTHTATNTNTHSDDIQTSSCGRVLLRWLVKHTRLRTKQQRGVCNSEYSWTLGACACKTCRMASAMSISHSLHWLNSGHSRTSIILKHEDTLRQIVIIHIHRRRISVCRNQFRLRSWIEKKCMNVEQTRPADEHLGFSSMAIIFIDPNTEQ